MNYPDTFFEFQENQLKVERYEQEDGREIIISGHLGAGREGVGRQNSTPKCSILIKCLPHLNPCPFT